MGKRTAEEIKVDLGLGSKICNKCGDRVLYKYFSKSAGGGDGYSYTCNSCKNKARRVKPEPNFTRTPEQVASDISVGSKVCSKCKERKIFKHFPNAKRGADGHDGTCYSCKPKRNQRYNLLSRYSLTPDEYDVMLTEGCEVCGSMYNLCVDHCHTSGKTRGCLCGRCNTALGMLEEDTERMERLIEYTKTKCL